MIIEDLTYEEYASLRDSLCEHIEGEVWIPVIDCPIYEVSSLGRFRAACNIVYSRSSRWAHAGDIKYYAHQIVPLNTSHEYIMVSLYDPKFRSNDNPYDHTYAHMLISWSFEGHKDDLTTDHINHNKHDNRICNLQRLSNQANNQKTYDNDEGGRWSKRRSAVVRSDGKYYKYLKLAVVDNNISDAALISAIHTGGTCGGYHWKYADTDKQAMIDSKRPAKRYHSGRRSTSKSYLVRHIESGKIDTCVNLAKQFKCVTDTIYYAIDYNSGYSKYLDATFELLDRKTKMAGGVNS